MTIFTYVFAFLIAIGVLVAVHEFGHFWMARRLGIRVVRFSIGFGRPLWRHRVADGTEYALSAIPLGGYVKLLDEREGPVPPEHLSQAYNRQPVWRRVLVLLAGPAANFLFAVCAYWVLFAVGVPALKPVIGEVTEDSIAARAGLAAGDEIVAVGGRETPTRETAVLAILDQLMQQRPIEIDLRRGDGAAGEAALRIPGSTRSPYRAGRAAAGSRLRLLVPDCAGDRRNGRRRQSGGAGGCQARRPHRRYRGRGGGGFPGSRAAGSAESGPHARLHH
jgi:regulator of sigma E protease